MAGSQGVIVNEGPPMIEVKNIFFKALKPSNYYSNEADADAVQNETAFQYFNSGLEVSNKYGCLFVSYDSSLYLIRIQDLLAAVQDPNNDSVTFARLKKLKLNNAALPATPNVISLSHNEEYLAVDTIRGDSASVVIFKLVDFINQRGSCAPFCEIRCCASPASKIGGISWNPGENMNKLLAINVDDGTLFLAKLIGPQNVELSRFTDGGVRSLCWSPKGKQLVIGRLNGNLSQLKLDLSVAKEIPKPGPDYIPISILWTQTTQFLIVFQKESLIDFMQLDLPKGGPPVYTNSGDIFISDSLPNKSSCYFLPFVPWNTVMAMTNSASDVVVLVKENQSNANELWIPGDVPDNRRAAFQLDNYARGAAVYFGSQDPVVFSETESYPPMPIAFLLSQRGSLLAFLVVNADKGAPSLKVDTTASIPDSIFPSSTAKTEPRPIVGNLPTPQSQQNQALPSQIESRQQQLPISKPSPFMPQQRIPDSVPVPQIQQPQSAAKVPQQSVIFNNPNQGQLQSSLFSPQQVQTVAKIQTGQPLQPELLPNKQSQPPQQPSQLGIQKLGGFMQQLPTDPRQLGTSTLPSAKDMAGLEKAVEEKRREMTSHLLQKGSELKGLEDDEQCTFVIVEVRKFEQRLADFVAKMDSSKINLSGILNTSFGAIEKSVLSTLNVVEDFANDMESTTSAQKEEVEILKERILNHFSQLEYAKSMVERSRDARYLQHMRSRPLDPASQEKFEEVSKLHNYITNQVAECRGYFYEQTRKRDSGYDRASCSQLIYMTLSNHSKIIRRLKTELDGIKDRLGLGKHAHSFDEAEYLAVCEPSYAVVSSNKKELPWGTLGTNESSQSEDITLTDLTAGISKVKLNQDSDRPDKKPIKLSNRKLLILKKFTPNVAVTKVKIEEAAWTRSPLKCTRPKPLEYPATTPESFISRLNQPAALRKSDIKISEIPKGVFSATAKGAETISLTDNSGGIANFGSSGSAYPSMMKPSMVSFGSTFSALSEEKPEVSLTTNLSSQQSSAMSNNPATSLLKSFPAQPLLSQPPSFTPTKNNNSALSSSAIQSPTLAGLLSTPPVSSTLSTSLNKQTLVSPKNNTLPPSTASSLSTDLISANPTPFSSGGKSSKTTTESGAFTFGKESNPSAFSSGLQSQPPATNTFSFSNPSAKSTTSTLSFCTVPQVADSPAKTTSIFGDSAKTQILPSSSPADPVATAKTATASDDKTELVSNTTTVLPGSLSFGMSSLLNVVDSTAKSTSPITPAKISTGIGGGSNIFGAPTNVVVGRTSTTSVEPTATGIASPTTIGDVQASKTAASGTNPVSITTITNPVTSSLGAVTSTGNSSVVSKAPTEGTTIGIPTATISVPGGGLFGSSVALTTTTSVTASTSAPSITTTSSGLFASPNTASPNVSFSAPVTTPATTASTAPSGFFSSASLFPVTTTTTRSAASPATGLMSSLNLSGPNNKVATTTAVTGGLFSSPSFGTTATTSPGNIFGGSSFGTSSAGFNNNAEGNPLPTSGFGIFGQNKTATSTPSVFGSSATITSSSGVFGNPAINTTSSGVFGNPAITTGSIYGSPTVTTATNTTGSIFGSPANVSAASPVFGGTATFGSSSPFGSSFGGNTGTTGGSIFGSTATSTNQTTTGFGAISQQQGAQTSAFGAAASSTFGGSQQQQGSIFGSPSAQPKPGLFSSTAFSTPASTTSGSIFGGGGGSGSIFGQSGNAGAFSSGATTGGVAQQGFGFSQAKPTTTGPSTFGSSPTATSPVFGGGATFGSSSPFGSSFAGSPTSTFASGTSVFGGTSATAPTTGFGTLAQQGSNSPGFGSPGFGSPPPPQQQQQQSSLFGSPAQQQAKPVFGGTAFSSWR